MEQIIKPNLDTCTLQEACDYAVAMIVKQGGRCMGKAKGGFKQDFCAYGNDKGGHCAVGWLLDDTNKDLMTYSGAVTELIGDFNMSVSPLIHDNIDVFDSLQVFHDSEETSRRRYYLSRLSEDIDTDKPQYKQWLGMGTDDE